MCDMSSLSNRHGQNTETRQEQKMGRIYHILQEKAKPCREPVLRNLPVSTKDWSDEGRQKGKLVTREHTGDPYHKGLCSM